MVSCWKVWVRMAPGRPWYAPLIDEDGSEATWESREDAEMIAQKLRIQEAAGIGELVAEQLGLNPAELAPTALEAIVLPDGERPLLSMRVQTLPSGEQVPVPTRGEFEDVVRKVAPPVGRKRPDATDRPPGRSD